jgi:hypothetical protein
MENGKKTKYKNIIHLIKDGELCYIDCVDCDIYSEAIDLEMLDSNEWILL